MCLFDIFAPKSGVKFLIYVCTFRGDLIYKTRVWKIFLCETGDIENVDQYLLCS